MVVLASAMAAASAHAVVFFVDTFTDGTAQISSTGPLSSDTDTGLASALGGERYSWVDRISAGGIVSLGINTFPFFNAAFYTSSSSGYGVGGLSYGHSSSLNLDLDEGALYTGFFLDNFGADDPAETGFIRLTVYSGSGTEAISKNIGAFEDGYSGWNFSEFATTDFGTISRIDLDWYGFTSEGADVEFTYFGITNTLPEPGTLTMLLIGGLFLRQARKRFAV